GLELGAQVGLGGLKALELLALVAGQHPPQQAEDQQAGDDAEADPVLARPRADVVEVQFLERHLALAHVVAPWSLAGAWSAGAGSAAGSSAAGASTGSAASTGAAASAGVAGAVSTGGTGSGMPSPS